ERMIRASLDAEDPLLAYQAAEIFGLKRLPQEDLVALAEALSAVEQADAFHAVQENLTATVMKDNPLLAAAIEFEQGKEEPARQLLSRIQVKALEDWRLALWARLMASTGRRATADQTLREIADEVKGSAGPAAAVVSPSVLPATAPPTPGNIAEAPPRPAPVRTFRRGTPTAGSNNAATPPRLIRRSAGHLDKRRPRRSRFRSTPQPVLKPPAFPTPFYVPSTSSPG
ncbi:MAG: hypothetical protein JSS20_15460, partial [Proteobacteria bacterium]|nr:hypothetical protein [Pseudomonadota bacterium]